MKLNRRGFLKVTAVGTTAAAFGGLGFDLKPAAALAGQYELKTKEAKATTSICCYCGVGCGLLVHTDTKTKRAINVEGDPDHPINEGALCAKGASAWQLVEGSDRPKGPLYRAPNSDKWEEKPWEWMLDEIAKRVHKTREETLVLKNAKGQVVNRCDGIAHVGSAALDNEELFPLQAIMRSLGLFYIEHQARLCHSSTVPALAESFGRGAMTNHWIDIKNSDCVLVMGSNAAENHPISFKWVKKAQANGAKLIHVDPRFTRTSTQADIYAPLRSGTDIAFLAGMAKYIMDKDLIQREYVANYTNAGFILADSYSFEDGLFSGFDPKTNSYDKSTWAFVMDENGIPKKDTTLQDPRCVYQMLRKHYERYDLDKVSAVTGTPKDKLVEVYEAYAATGKPDKSGTIMYAMGWTQHTVGVQNIRAMAINQLLLGNIGMAGGGVNAMRGESNVQGATDMALLEHILPGYLATPRAALQSFEEYNKKYTPVSKDEKSANWWGNFPKYSASLLKAMWPDVDPNESYNWLPKGEDGKGYTWLYLFDDMFNGQFKGFFAWGMNPACGGANAVKTREALAKLDWLVNVNLFDNETGSFWRGPDADPKKIKTEVFFLPCCTFMEKDGSLANSGRWAQWRYQGPEPMPGTLSDGHIMLELFERIQKLYKKEPGKLADPVLKLNTADWKDDHGFKAEKVARVINGYFLKDVTIGDKTYKAGDLVPGFPQLQADGSTCSGNWLYCNAVSEEGIKSQRRDKTQTEMQAKIGLFPNWSWAWPMNRRIVYNRASVNLEGKPYAPEKAVIAWDGEKWQGDVPDGGWAPGAKHPFIMKTDGHAGIFGPGRTDGPFPEHYEPMECPVIEHHFSKQLHTPTAVHFQHEEKAVCDPRFPFVCTTYRVTEHWQTGLMTRYQGWLIEAEPQIFCEMSEELAALRSIQNGDKVWLESVRGKVWAKAMVTKRIKPFTIMGQTVHLVGLPWHFGWITPKNGGDSANLLTPSVGDPNTGIPESKAFMVNVTKA